MSVSRSVGLFKFARKQRLVSPTWTPPTRGMDLPEPAPIKTYYFTANDIDRLVKVARTLDTPVLLSHWGTESAHIRLLTLS